MNYNAATLITTLRDHRPLVRECSPFFVNEWLSRYLGREIYEKDDTEGPYGPALNKIRKLEFIIPSIVADDNRLLITAGSLPSSQALAVSMVADMLRITPYILYIGGPGLECPAMQEYGNHQLTKGFGPQVEYIYEPWEKWAIHVDRVRFEATRKGLRPRVVDPGVSEWPGQLGYTNAYLEIIEQLGTAPDYIFVPFGSGNLMAGLLIGSAVVGSKTKIIGCCFSRSRASALLSLIQILEKVHERIIISGISSDSYFIDDSSSGIYAKFNASEVKMQEKFSEISDESVDPVYSLRVLNTMTSWIKSGRIKEGESIVWLKTSKGWKE